MISILNLENSHSLELAELIKSFTDDFIITNIESELLKSSKIIISFSGSIQKALRKIHLMNLFSALRMISDKPVLGINSGMHLMCESIDNISCLAMLPGSIVKVENLFDDNPAGNYSEIKILENDLLLNGLDEKSEFYFEQYLFLPKNSFTTSVLKNNPNLSATVRKNNFYGIQFLPQKSGENGLKILKNFISI